MKRLRFKCFIRFSLFLPIWMTAQTTVPNQYFTVEISSEKAPKIDGLLDDSIWSMVDWGSDFIEVFPDENTAPSEQTKFKIYTTKSIYT